MSWWWLALVAVILGAAFVAVMVGAERHLRAQGYSRKRDEEDGGSR